MPSESKGIKRDLVVTGSMFDVVDNGWHCDRIRNPSAHGQYHVNVAGRRLADTSDSTSDTVTYRRAPVSVPSSESLGVECETRQQGKPAGRPHFHITANQVQDPGTGPAPAADLPSLKLQARWEELGTASGGVSTRRPLDANSDFRYTSRQRALLERDSNIRNAQEPAMASTDGLGAGRGNIKWNLAFSGKLSPNQQRLTQLAGLRSDEQLQCDSPGRLKLKDRPLSSQLPSASFSSTVPIVSRHSSDTLINCTTQPELLPPSPTDRYNQHSVSHTKTSPPPSMGKFVPEQQNWSSKSSTSLQLENIVLDDCPTHIESSSSRGSNCLSYRRSDLEHREYINTLVLENKAIKREVQKSIKRLIQHSGLNSPTGCKAEGLHDMTSELTRTGSMERPGSIQSDDSGISSESITQNQSENQIKLPAHQREQLDLILGIKSAHIDANRMAKVKRKKQPNRKLKSRTSSASGKKSRLKFRITSVRKRNVNGVSTMPKDPHLCKMTEYCRTSSVAEGTLRSKEPVSSVSTRQVLAVNAGHSIIYKDLLPRVGQSSFSCEGNSFKESKAKRLEPSPSLHNTRKSLVSSTAKMPPPSSSLMLLSTRKSLTTGSQIFLGEAEEPARVTKVYLSERQSGMQTELGIDLPCAPPATPMPDTTKTVEYIPSMYDIRAQRAVKTKLDAIERHEKKRMEKLQEQKCKKDKMVQKESVKEAKRSQRQQIYALNKVMTAWENNNFLAFCREHGIDGEL